MDRYNVGLMQEYRHCEGGRRGGCGEHNKATLTVMEREWEQVMYNFTLEDRYEHSFRFGSHRVGFGE